MRQKFHDILVGAGVAALLLAPVPVLAADVSSEIATAATHATLASQATAIGGVQMHLHHALNCIVGPSDNRFDAKQLNPCAGSGNGAIPDMSDAAKKKALQTAASTTVTGLASTDLTVAQKTAAQVATQLKAIQ